jgi:hypothetical protein
MTRTCGGAGALLLLALALPGVSSAQAPPEAAQEAQRVGAPAAPAPVVAAADWSASLTARPASRSRRTTREIRVRLVNRSLWAITSIRACWTVPTSARVTALEAPLHRRSDRSVCTISARLAPRQALAVRFTVRSARLAAGRALPVAVAVRSGNARDATGRALLRRRTVKAAFRLVEADPATVRAAPRAARPRQATAACSTAAPPGIAFVADDSGSMKTSDPDLLRAQAVAVGVDSLADGAWAAVTSFDSRSRVLAQAAALDPATRPALRDAGDALYPSGDTQYDLGFAGAREQLDAMPATVRKAVVFLSDGAPTDEDFSGDRPLAAAGVPIYTIGFGDADQDVLSGIASRSGGQSYAAASASELQSIYARVLAAITCASPTTRTAVTLAPGAVQTVPFRVGLDDAEWRALASWTGGQVKATAVRPNGTTMALGATAAGESIASNDTYALLTATTPAVGRWQLRLEALTANVSDVSVSIDVFDKAIPQAPARPAVDPVRQGRRVDPCDAWYGAPTSSKSKGVGVERTTYDRRSSQWLVCTGYGMPGGLEMSPAMKCALIASGAVLVGGHTAGPVGPALDALCDTADVLTALNTGSWGGVVGSQACRWTSMMFATAGGIVVAGASAPLGPAASLVLGTLTYRALAGGLPFVCDGTFRAAIGRWGEQLEENHHANIARDVRDKGLCIQQESRRVLGLKYRAVPCAA